MSVLQKIRNRAGLLIAVVGVALLIFILQAAFESGSSFFTSNDRNVGEIAGKNISIEEFDFKVREQVENYKRNSQQATIEPSIEEMFVQQTWSQMVNEIVMTKEYEKLGISVSDDELYDLMLVHPHQYVVQQFTDRESGRINKDFADPMGQLDLKKINALVQQFNDQQAAAWADLEKAVKKARIAEKYNNLIKKGMYTTTLAAKYENVSQNKSFNIRYVVKRFGALADSTIKVNDDDLLAYYNTHQNDYKQDSETRNAEYITFDAVPSQEDYDLLKQDMVKIADEFKTKAKKEDSTYVISESDSRNFDVTLHKKGTLSPEIDSLMFASTVGFTYGPYMENNMYKLAKLIDTKVVADSAKVRHILISLEPQTKPGTKRTLERTKVMADSIAQLIKDKKKKFEDLVKEVSEDPGSIAKGGDYGWMNASSGFVEPYKNAGLMGKKGDLKVVETQFGHHIIEVLDRSKGESKMVQVAIIDKKIEPSTKTIQEYFKKASEFAGKYKNAEEFSKGVEAEKLNKRVAENIKEGDKTIAGLDSPRDLVRWMYNEKTEKGAVSEAFEFNNKFVVAVLTEIRPKGVAPFEIVKEEIVPKAIEQKKAEKYKEELAAALNGNTTIDALAQKTQLPLEKMDNLTFNSFSLPGAGREDNVIGTVVTLKSNTLSKPIVGASGVYVVVVDAVKEAPELKDVNAFKTQTSSSASARVDSEVFEALKDNANVVDNKAKFY